MIPYFSIVVSVYNKEKHIAKTLNSVLSQTFSDFEVIVVNDGSTDNSLSLINSFTDERLLCITQPNQGASACRNHGLKLAKGHYIALLDGDDYWDNVYLQTMYDATIKHPEENVFATAVAEVFKHKTVPVTYSFTPTSKISTIDYFKSSHIYTVLTSSSIVFKKSVLETIGFFNPNIVSGQDIDYWIRIGLHYQIVFINSILVYYVHDEDSLSNSTINIDHKPKYDSYKTEEAKNPDLKKFLDRNRYSLALLSKVNNFKEAFVFYSEALDSNNLSIQKRILLKLPTPILKGLITIKSSLSGEKNYYPFR